MKKNPSSNKKNSKTLLSTTIEQIKRDLKGEYNEYHESPIENNNTNWKQKKLIKINIIILELNQKKQIMKRAKIKITIRILIKKY